MSNAVLYFCTSVNQIKSVLIYYCLSVTLCLTMQNTTMSELKTRVEELKMENEYQLRLKDMNYNEKIKDLTDKFLQEIEGVKAKNEVSDITYL